MNSVEAQRVLGVMDDALHGLRLVSHVTPELLAAAGDLADALGQDVQQCLLQHASALVQLPDDFRPGDLQASSGALLRALQKSPGAEGALPALAPERSPAMLQLLSYFERCRAQLGACLGTTVEEDARSRETLAALAGRRERAAADRLALQHKLALQRAEIGKQEGALQAAHDAAAAALAELHSSDAAGRAAVAAAAAGAATSDQQAFSCERDKLAKQLEAARAELAALRSTAAAAGAAARKGVTRAAQDCEAAIGEYDGELAGRQAEVETATAALAELQAATKRAQAEADALHAERLAYDEAVRAAAEERWRRDMRELRRAAAAYAIQNAWKVWRKRRAAEAKKGGGKGGAKGGKASAQKQRPGGSAAGGKAGKKK